MPCEKSPRLLDRNGLNLVRVTLYEDPHLGVAPPRNGLSHPGDLRTDDLVAAVDGSDRDPEPSLCVVVAVVVEGDDRSDPLRARHGAIPLYREIKTILRCACKARYSESDNQRDCGKTPSHQDLLPRFIGIV